MVGLKQRQSQRLRFHLFFRQKRPLLNDVLSPILSQPDVRVWITSVALAAALELDPPASLTWGMTGM